MNNGMFGVEKGFRARIMKLDTDASDVAHQEKLKSVRKRLIIAGISLLAIGGVGLIVNFVLFSTVGFATFERYSYPPPLVAPMVLMPICVMIVLAGIFTLNLGLSIRLGGTLSSFIGESTSSDNAVDITLSVDAISAQDCENAHKKSCAHCGVSNESDSVYCKKCGSKFE